MPENEPEEAIGPTLRKAIIGAAVFIAILMVAVWFFAIRQYDGATMRDGDIPAATK